MFGQEFTDVPIVAVSIHESLSPADNWKVGAALKELRYVLRAHILDSELTLLLAGSRNEGILILSGGLDIHAFRPRTLLHEETAPSEVLSFHKEVLSASTKSTVRSLPFAIFIPCLIRNARTYIEGRTVQSFDEAPETPRPPNCSSTRGAPCPCLCCSWCWR